MASPTPDVAQSLVLLSLSCVTGILAFTATAVRFHLRMRGGCSFRPDDGVIAIAMLAGIVGAIFAAVEGSMATSSSALQFHVLGQPWMTLAATSSNISVCLYFSSFLGRPWVNWIRIWTSILAVVWFGFAMTVAFQCRPLQKLWNPEMEGLCWDSDVERDFTIVQGAISVVSWLLLVFCPVVMLRELPPLRHFRWLVCAFSGFSFLVGMLAVARIYETSRAGSGSVYGVDTYYASLLLVLEQSFGLIAGNFLPIVILSARPKFTNNSRIRGKTPSQGDSTLSLNRLSSGTSDRRARPASSRTSVLDPNWSTKLYIEGGSQGSSGQRVGQNKDIASWSHETLDTQAWPKGIVKTVTIDVTEENTPYIQPTAYGQSTTSSKMSVEQDWETMLRRGPSPRYG